MKCTSPFTVFLGGQRDAGRRADAAALKGVPLSVHDFDPVDWSELKKQRQAKPRTRGDGGFAVNCGMCFACRVTRVAHNTTRGMAEFRHHGQVGVFLTLTFADERIRCDHGVRVRDAQLFKKRLRDRIGPFRSVTIGEYGDQNARPHYHVLVFGKDFFEGRKRATRTAQGDILYEHEVINEAWAHQGFAWFGEITRDRTGGIDYVMRYSLKQAFGDHLRKEYGRELVAPGFVQRRDLSGFIPGDEPGEYFSKEDGSRIPGNLFEVPPQFALLPRRPGLGALWFDQYWREVLHAGDVNWYGRRRPIPPYFLRRAKHELGEEAERLVDEYLERRAAEDQRADDIFWTEEIRRTNARGDLVRTTRRELQAMIRTDPLMWDGSLLREYDAAMMTLQAQEEANRKRAVEYRQYAMKRQERSL